MDDLELVEYWRRRAQDAEQRLEAMVKHLASFEVLRPPPPIVMSREDFAELRRREAFNSLPDDFEVN